MSNNKILKLYTQLSDLEALKRQAQKEADSYTKQINTLKAALAVAIPPNTETAGILHKVTEKKSISYAKLYDNLLENVIPKTRRTEVENLKTTCYTTTTETHTFKQVTA